MESYIDAKPISYYVEHKHIMNPYIAKVGMNVLYRMIFYENFVHSDCHAGNILVSIKNGKPIIQSWYEKIEGFIAFDLVPGLMEIYTSGKIPKTKLIPSNDNFEIKIAFIDAGMVTSFTERDQSHFFQLIWAVINRNS